jgi:hypothetical protein
MPLMLGALYRALREAEVVEEHARLAAEEVAAYESRLQTVESKLTLLTWMVGALLIMVSGLFWQGFAIMGRLPR